MNRAPGLSVIVPTYNRGKLLTKTLQSVFAHTYSDYEIIVVDDGSTDRTEEVVARLVRAKPRGSERIRYFFQRNQGTSVALNKGLSEAKGEWIAFLDSGDLWLPTKIVEQLQALQRYTPQSQACFTDARFINNPSFQGTAFGRAGERFPERTGLPASPVELIGEFWVYMQSILLPSKAMTRVGEFDPAFWSGQDEDFLLRLSLQTELCYVNSPLVLIDCTPRRQERLTEVRAIRSYEVLKLRQHRYQKWLGLTEGCGSELRTALREHLRGVQSEQANWLLANRRYGEARRASASAVRTQCRPGILAKWCLATVAPAFARHIVIRRSRRANKGNSYRSLPYSDVKEGVPSLPEGPA